MSKLSKTWQYQKELQAKLYKKRYCFKCCKPNPNWPDRMCNPCRNRARNSVNKWSAKKKAYNKLRAQKYRQTRKDIVLNYYGNVCACCKETEKTFLCIDHIKNDGGDHRRLDTSACNIVNWLIKHKFPKGFQTLCHNCNFAKRLGVCPHQLPQKAGV